MKSLKSDFPIFANNPELVYLDSAVTSQKPQPVIDTVNHFYTHQNANIHRGLYDLSQHATDMFETTRQKVADFIGAEHPSEIVFTSNASEAINVVAVGWAEKFLKSGDIVVTSEMEHHSNFVPWLRLKEKIGIELLILPVNKDYQLDYKISDIDFSRVKLLALTHVSNVLGTINPVAEIAAYFKQRGTDAKLLIDAAQSVPHLLVDVKKLDADFMAFSSHKMLGPSGVGVLYAKKQFLDDMDPLLVGSQMISSVTKESATWAEVPSKFEPGTRNLEGVMGLGAAIDYLQAVGISEVAAYEHELTKYTLEQFKNESEVTIFGPNTARDRIGVFSFAIGNVHPHDVAEILNRSHIAIRAGHHCAQPLMKVLGVSGTARASTYLYNSIADVDALIQGIQEVKRVFHV
jgi:cysteine desulfurase / selenocysteine lyase